MASSEYDLIIVGGGLTGASLAVAMRDSGLRIAVIESFAADARAQPSYDERTIALTYSSRHIYDQIGVWDDALDEEACPIDSIHISNKGHLGLTRLSCQDACTPALGYVVPTRALGAALHRCILAAHNIKLFCPFEALQIETRAEHASIDIQSPGKASRRLQGDLIVIADGGRSPLLDSLGLIRDTRAYAQSALLSIVRSNIPHRHKAYERFMQDGPLALLPMTEQRFAVVWTLDQNNLERIAALSDNDYIDQLQAAFGTRAGLFSQPSPRKTYPLAQSLLKIPYSERVVALGNAAHTVHPVAGQGFNLGLRDVAALTEILFESLDQQGDIGSRALLETYQQTRRRDTQRVVKFTDGLLNIFGQPSALLGAARNLGLFAVENLPFVKRALLRRSMGLGRQQPKLARGLALTRHAKQCTTVAGNSKKP